MDRSRTHEPASGFTLIEVAVVVAVIGALMTLGLSFLNAQMLSSAKILTTRKQDLVKEALIAYLGLYKQLPCPDVPNNTNGTADSSGVTGRSDVTAGNACVKPFGVLPYATLGLSREAASDGWSDFFSYRVDTEASVPPTPCGIVDWAQAGCFGAGKRGRIQVNDSSVTGDPSLTQNAIAVIVSHGPNGLGAWAGATPNAPPPPGRPETCEERRNADRDTSDCTAPVLPANTYFRGEREGLDDVLAWLDASEAINALARQGAVKNAAAQLNEDLQALYDAVLAEQLAATLSSPPPSPPFACSATVAAGSRDSLDPWGNPYFVELPGSGSGLIDVCSQGCSSCLPPIAKLCRRIERSTFSAYLAKQGYPPCT